MRSETILLKARDLCAAPDNARGLRNLSFEVWAGEIIAVFGPSGSGKSLLIQALSDELELSGGALECADFAVPPPLPATRMGRPPSPANYLKRYAHSLSRSVYLMELFGLSARADQPVQNLSDGERAMLQLAAAFSQNKPLYFLDDPFDRADFERFRRLWQEMEDRCRFNSAVLFTTRNPEVAARADRVLMLHEGQLIAQGEPEELMREASAKRIEIETDEPDKVSRLLEPVEVRILDQGDHFRLSLYADDDLALRLLKEGYGQVRAVVIQKPSLSDAWHLFVLKNRRGKRE